MGSWGEPPAPGGLFPFTLVTLQGDTAAGSDCACSRVGVEPPSPWGRRLSGTRRMLQGWLGGFCLPQDNGKGDEFTCCSWASTSVSVVNPESQGMCRWPEHTHWCVQDALGFPGKRSSCSSEGCRCIRQRGRILGSLSQRGSALMAAVAIPPP